MFFIQEWRDDLEQDVFEERRMMLAPVLELVMWLEFVNDENDGDVKLVAVELAVIVSPDDVFLRCCHRRRRRHRSFHCAGSAVILPDVLVMMSDVNWLLNGANDTAIVAVHIWRLRLLSFFPTVTIINTQKRKENAKVQITTIIASDKTNKINSLSLGITHKILTFLWA